MTSFVYCALPRICRSVLQGAVVCRSVSQRVAVCCSVHIVESDTYEKSFVCVWRSRMDNKNSQGGKNQQCRKTHIKNYQPLQPWDNHCVLVFMTTSACRPEMRQCDQFALFLENSAEIRMSVCWNMVCRVNTRAFVLYGKHVINVM